MATLSAPSLYLTPSETALKLHYVGKHLKDVQAPAAILDVAVIRRNCKLMLDTTKTLGLGFRAHVKTHKTTQLTRLQMGEDSKSVNLIASTVSEIEHLVPYLQEQQSRGRNVNVLYGLPVAPSHIPRLATVSRILGPGCVSLFVDQPAHVEMLSKVEDETWPGQINVFVKVDAGYHRAGLSPESASLDKLAQMIGSQQKVKLQGAYAHMGHSYSSSSPEEALKFLRTEIEEVSKGAARLTKALPQEHLGEGGKLTISLGATPTATATQNILAGSAEAEEFRSFINEAKKHFDVEIHAGVYPVLDMQQLATRARPATGSSEEPLLSFRNLGLRIMVEVASVYDEREKPEALIAAGSIVLGREPCKSYHGWGVVTPWSSLASGTVETKVFDPEGERSGWIVGRISQEHGMLTWEGPQEDVRKLQIGEKLLVWPNHACMAGPSFWGYLIVDSDKDAEKIDDVWVRWRGW
ncbi:hypothetical protein M8818_000291 [Zalaria obscura]|uniref:Uncharacterized protein n=1 Tax=Zalaria obscura TaxID=2024903 RepID=A0ACC3SPI4_9PEZI